MRGDENANIKKGSQLGVSIDPGEMSSGASFSGFEINHFWLNVDGKYFSTQSGISGADSESDSRAIALLDYDRDGYQDFVMVGGNRPFVQLFRNKIGDLMSVENRYEPIYLNFVGGNNLAKPSSEWSARDGVGVIVKVFTDDMTLIREQRCSEGLSAQNSATMQIGIGPRINAKLVIDWPSGKQTVINQVYPGDWLTVYENPLGGVNTSHALKERPRVAAGLPKEQFASDLSKFGESLELLKLSKPYTDSKYRLFMSWFVHCSACKRAKPKIDAIVENFDEQYLQVLGFNNDPLDGVEEMQAYQEKYQPAYKMMIRRSQRDIELFKAEQDRLTPPIGDIPVSQQTPAIILIDNVGKVVFADVGVPTYSKLKQVILDWEGRSDF